MNCFVGGLPAGSIFWTNSFYLKEMIGINEDKSWISNPYAESYLIALVAYFEAFSKNLFSSINKYLSEDFG